MRFFLLSVFLGISFKGSSQKEIHFIAADSPGVFAPGIISDGFANRDMTISPDGNDLFFTIQWYFGMYSVILHASKMNGHWTKPDTAWFSGRWNDLEPAYSPDGSKIFFTSNRPLIPTDSAKTDYDIWCIQKKGNQWEEPFNIGPPVNTNKDEFYPSFTRKGNLYFTRNHEEAGDDIFFSMLKDEKYTMPQPLPETINSKEDDFNAFVDPDENYIIFSSYKREDDLGKGDLYYSLKKNGSWIPAVHLNMGINSSTLDYSPFVTADQKYFFFTSKRLRAKFPFEQAKSLKEIRKILDSYGNGFEDIYIMNFDAIRKIMK